MVTDPEGSVYLLKQQTETIRQFPEMDSDRGKRLLDMLSMAARQARLRNLVMDRRRQEQRESIAVASESEYILNESEQPNASIDQLMQRFDSLMDEAGYRYAQEPSVFGSLRSWSSDHLTDAMRLRVQREIGVVDKLHQVEKGAPSVSRRAANCLSLR